MEAASQSSFAGREFAFLTAAGVRNLDQVKADLAGIWQCGAPPDLLEGLRAQLATELVSVDDPDAAISHLGRFIDASRSPTSLLALFERDAGALAALLQVFSTSDSLANDLIADPESFDLIRASDGQPAPRRYLVDEIVAATKHLEQPERVAQTIGEFVRREHLRIAYGEFVRGVSPDKVGRQLAFVADSVIEAALAFSLQNLCRTQPLPEQPDGTPTNVTVIGLGNYGGEELSYHQPLNLVFLYDALDEKNVSHREFYATLVRNVCQLLQVDEQPNVGFTVDLSENPRYDDNHPICSVDDVMHTLESSGETWQRLAFVKARVVAGSQPLGESLLRRLAPWIYRRYLNRADLADIRTLRHKLERRAEQVGFASDDVVADPGGRHDIELTIQFLQLLHGGDLQEVRVSNTIDAIFALERAGCLTKQESMLLSGNHARLCRLEHELAVMSGASQSRLSEDPQMRTRIAWRLGIRKQDDEATESVIGDAERFIRQLTETFAVNRKIINHLIIDAPHEVDVVPDETELMLDPEPDAEQVTAILSRHGFAQPMRAMDDLVALSTESTPYLSPRRCRHFFSLIAPTLLSEISQTPNPHATLATLVRVTDSIGAKSMLWELFGSNRPTMRLMVRLCAATPYLTGILTRNPGMIDELVDSLLTNRLPSKERLDAQSIQWCRGAEDIEPILHSFKNSAHLTIGVRDVLGMESVESTHAALADTAEACVRRVIENERESLAQRFGDPMTADGEPAEFVAIALGKFGGREPNYHSDLEVVFTFDGNGETLRRVGGRRATTTNHHFFNQLAQAVIARVNHLGSGGRLYELDNRLRTSGDEGAQAILIDEYLKRFRQGTASLWQRLSLCKARPISGSRGLRQKLAAEILDVIVSTKWRCEMATEIRAMRSRMQQSATAENLKRGEGGTVDVELISQTLTLKAAGTSPKVVVGGTTASLELLAKEGFLAEEDALALISNYRTLRWVEANLRLMNTAARHELPDDDESLRHLAFLMNENDPAMILARCQHARQSNRRIFDCVFDALARDST